MIRRPAHRQSEALKALDLLNQGAWCVVCDMSSRVLSWIEVGRMPDWRVRFMEMIEAARAAGWVLEEEHPVYASFFCRRADQRVFVSLQPTRPRNRLAEWELPVEASNIRACFGG